MSLEATIQENTAAIRDLIAALANGVPTTVAQVAAVVDQAPAEAVAEAQPASTARAAGKNKPEKADPKPETLAQMNGAQAEKALEGHANAPKDQPTYQDAANAVTKLARTKGRDVAIQVLAQFDAKTLPDVKAEQFADVIAACEKAGA